MWCPGPGVEERVLDVAVAGVGMTRFGRLRDLSFRDLAADAFEAALLMAGLERGDVDALVLAAESDTFTLQLNPSAVVADDLGLVGAAASRVEGGGASGGLAVQAGAARILAGLSRRVAVVGVDVTASSLPGDAVRDLYGFSFDAWAEGMTGVTATALYALSFQAWDGGATEDDLARVVLKNRGNACLNPRAHLPRRHEPGEVEASPLVASPYRRLHCSPLSDGAAVVILARPADLPATRRGAPRLLGIGAATDAAHLGARARPGRFAAKSVATRRALEMAGIGPEAVVAAEVYDAYAGAELQGVAALGLSENPVADLRAGRFDGGGALPVNLSGGLLGQGAPPGATGVAQVATCALLVEGRYHPGLQPAHPVDVALADTHGGVCTTAAVTIVGAAT